VVLADFNRDGRQDILAVGAIPEGIRSGGVSLLLGNATAPSKPLFSSPPLPKPATAPSPISTATANLISPSPMTVTTAAIRHSA